jgi:signal transduction histidine kinase
LLAGVSLYLLSAFIEIGLYYSYQSQNKWISNFYVFHWGILAFVCSLVAVVVHRFVNKIKEKDLFQRTLLQTQKEELETVTREKEMQRMFSRQLIQTQEQERQRIAGELHDSIGQELLIVKNKLQLKLNSEEKQKIEDVSDMLSRSIQDLSRISHDLRPSEIDELGLTIAVESMLERVGDASGIRFDFQMDPIDEMIKKEDRINLFRIIQEAVNNIVKHSKATKAVVRSEISNEHIVIEVSDNGIGFTVKTSEDKSRPHFGLTDMKDRAELMNGSIKVNSDTNGTKVNIAIPVQ